MTPTPHPYPAYRPSGVPWLGDVPMHWELVPSRAVFTEINERDHPDEQMLSVTIARGVIRQQILLQDSSQKDSSRLDKSAYKLVCPGDLAYNKMRAWQGAIGVSTYRGIVSPAYIVQRPRNGADALYFHHLLRTPAFSAEAERWSYGIASDMWSLRPEHFKMMYIPLPPLPEQTAIVRYLDHVDRRIRRYVSAKRKLIALLEEEKRAIVNQAVTRGLDPNVRLQPSGVEWLGDVPEHWEVVPVKRAFLSMDYGISESASDSGTIRLLTMGHLKDGQVMVPNDGGVDSVAPHLLLEKGDLLFNRTNSQELVGKVGLFVGYDSPVTFASYLVRMRPHPSHEPEYLNVALNDSSFISRARREAIPSLHQSNLNPTRYGRIHIALPPKEEQGVILRTLRKETASLRDAIARARRQVELVQEYRTRLIADVVTGKLDVREAASQLPDESDEEGPIDRDGLVLDNMDDGSSDVSQLLEEEQTMEREVTA